MREDDWSFFDEPQFKEALSTYEDMIHDGSSVYMSADDLTDIAEYYMAHNRNDEAMTCINYALSLHPDSVDPMVFLARHSLFEGDVTKAQNICDAISEQQDWEVIFLRAEILLKEGQTDKGLGYLEEKYNECEEDKALFLNDCIDICYDYYLYEKGLEWAELLCTNHSDYEKKHLVLADMLILNGKNERALSILDLELKENPYNIKAWTLSVEAHCAEGHYDDALEAVEFALAINPTEEHALLAKANCLFHQNKLEEAHQQYMAYQHEYPNDDNGFYLDGMCLTNMERYQKAVDCLAKAFAMDHTRSGLAVQIGVQYTYALSKLGHMDKALEILDATEALSIPEDNFERNVLRGHVLLENGQEKEAYLEFRKALEKSKEPNTTQLTIAISLCENQKYNEVIEIIQHIEANLSEEQHALAMPYIAYSYYNLGEWHNYIHYLKIAIKENRETTEFLFSPIYPGLSPDEYLEKATNLLHDTN